MPDQDHFRPAYRVARRLPLLPKVGTASPSPNTAEYVVEGPFGSEHGSFATAEEAAAEAARLNWIPARADLQRQYSGAALNEVNERVQAHFDWFVAESYRLERLLEGAQLDAHRARLAVVDAKKAAWDQAYAAERDAMLRLGFRNGELLPDTCRALDEVRAALRAFTEENAMGTFTCSNCRRLVRSLTGIETYCGKQYVICPVCGAETELLQQPTPQGAPARFTVLGSLQRPHDSSSTCSSRTSARPRPANFRTLRSVPLPRACPRRRSTNSLRL